MINSRMAKAIICLAAILCGLFVAMPEIKTEATTTSSLKDQIAGLEAERDKLKNEVADLKAQRAPIAQIKAKLDRQVANLEAQIEACTSAIYKLDSEIETSKNQIAEF